MPPTRSQEANRKTPIARGIGVSLLLLASGLFAAEPSVCLKIMNFDVPQTAAAGETLELGCLFELATGSASDRAQDSDSFGERLYAVKWYKDGREFYHYLERGAPQRQAFPVDGVSVDLEKSNNQTLTLQRVSLKSSGVYKCEVSTDAPLFITLSAERRMLVFYPPISGPKISVARPEIARSGELRTKRLHLGQQIELTCQSGDSKPAPTLDWILGDRLNLSALVSERKDDKSFPFELTNRRLVRMPKATEASGSMELESKWPPGGNDQLVELMDTRQVSGSDTLISNVPFPLDQLMEISHSQVKFVMGLDFFTFLLGNRSSNWRDKPKSVQSNATQERAEFFAPKQSISNRTHNLAINKHHTNRLNHKSHIRPLGGHRVIRVRCISREMNMGDEIRLEVTNEHPSDSTTKNEQADAQMRSSSVKNSNLGTTNGQWISIFPSILWMMLSLFKKLNSSRTDFCFTGSNWNQEYPSVELRIRRLKAVNIFYLALICAPIYGYAIYFLNQDRNVKGIDSLYPEKMRLFGQFKFVTHHCLIMQLAYTILHLGSYMISSLKRIRDFVFTTLAWPIGVFVVSAFWTVWSWAGREMIFPKELDPYYPNWANHVSHSMILPINMIFLFLVDHNFNKQQSYVSLVYCLFYMIQIHYVYFKGGRFLYQCIDLMNPVQRWILFATSAIVVISSQLGACKVSALIHRQTHQQTSRAFGKSVKRD